MRTKRRRMISPPRSERISDDQLSAYLEQAVAYSGLKIRISRWSPSDGWTRYQLVNEEDGTAISDSMTRSEMYSHLVSLCEFYYHVHSIKLRLKLRRYRKAKGRYRNGEEQEQTTSLSAATTIN